MLGVNRCMAMVLASRVASDTEAASSTITSGLAFFNLSTTGLKSVAPYG